MDTSSGFFRQTFDSCQQLRVFIMNQLCKIPTIIKDHVQGLSIWEVDGLLDAPEIFFVSFSFPSEDGNSPGSHSSSSMVICRQPAILAPLRGFEGPYFLRKCINPGIS